MNPLQHMMINPSFEGLWELYFEARELDSEHLIVDWAQRYGRMTAYTSLTRFSIGLYQFKQARNAEEASVRDEAFAAAAIHIMAACRHAPLLFLSMAYKGMPSADAILGPMLGGIQAQVYLATNPVGDVRWTRAQKLLLPCCERLVKLAVQAIPYPMERRLQAFQTAAEIMSGLEHRR